MLDVYFKQIRSVLELAVTVWQPGLTIGEERQIERVQKTTFYVILGDDYQSYESSLKLLGAEPLAKRRESICLNFARKALNTQNINTGFLKIRLILFPHLPQKQEQEN